MTIVTSYHGPTDKRGACIVARVALDGRRKRLTVPYDYALDRDTLHREAADALAARAGLVVERLSGEHEAGFYFSSRRA